MSDWLQRISPCVRPATQYPSKTTYTSHAEASPSFSDPLRVIYDHELILYSGSVFTVEIEGEEYFCEQDSFIIIPPGKVHMEYNSGGKAARRYWCHFDWSYQPGYENTPGITFFPGEPKYQLCRMAPDWVPSCPIVGQISQPERTFGLARRLTEMMSVGTESVRLQSRSLLLELLLILLSEHDASPPVLAEKRPLPSRIRRALELTVSEDAYALSLPVILKDLGYSYEYLCRVFKQTYGISPLRYMNAVRVTRARHLLRSSTLHVAEIAYKVGFNDSSHFAKIFKNLLGETPNSYRKRFR